MARKQCLYRTGFTLCVISYCLLTTLGVNSAQEQPEVKKIADNDIHNNDIIDLDHNLHNEEHFESKHPDNEAKIPLVYGTIGPKNATNHQVQYCSAQSIVRARQYINYKLDTINNLINVWLNDVDSQEIMEQQKRSLANLILTTDESTSNRPSINSNQVLNNEGQPYIEIESSYFKPLEAFSKDVELAKLMRIPAGETPAPIGLRLIRRYRDKCHLNMAEFAHVYQFAISVGPFVHSLDFIQHLPHELRLSQPIDWHYCQARMLIQRMIFEVSLRQRSTGSLAAGCPLELIDVTHLKHLKQRPYKLMLIKGFSSRNETDLANQLSLSRFFDDYTLPSLTNRVRHLLRFHFEGESLPLV